MVLHLARLIPRREDYAKINGFRWLGFLREGDERAKERTFLFFP
jgi:hypothetical protein